jgi:undecaprenyl diphosphate synthase
MTRGIPDPDLMIRTSGESRISNFLMWQLAYAELFFTNTLWPDFCKADMEEAIAFFNGRDRRYGGLSRKAAIS